MPEDGDLWGTLYSAVRNAQQSLSVQPKPFFFVDAYYDSKPSF